MEYFFCGIFDVTQQFMIFQQLFINITFVSCVYSTKTEVAIIFYKSITDLFSYQLNIMLAYRSINY